MLANFNVEHVRALVFIATQEFIHPPPVTLAFDRTTPSPSEDEVITVCELKQVIIMLFIRCWELRLVVWEYDLAVNP